MLFAVIYKSKSTSEELDQRAMSLSKNSSPPEELELQSHHVFADNSGGLAIVEASSAESLLAGTAPWSVFNEYTIHPLVEFSAAMTIFDKALTWRKSVS